MAGRRAFTLRGAGVLGGMGAFGAVGMVSTTLLGACSVLSGPSRITMDTIDDDRACPATQAPVLLVLLPGANMATSELQREGFVAAVRQRGLAVDVTIADAHMGYVLDGSILQRLNGDVIAPARAQGYRRVWLAGISLGGFVAMGYALRHPGEVEGLFTIAPYLGRRPLLQAIVDAGGPARWRETARPRDDKDFEHEVWMWLSAPAASNAVPPLWLGYGAEDRYADGHRLLAGVLAAVRVSTAPGGHDWPPWKALWAQWLDRGLLPRSCTA